MLPLREDLAEVLLRLGATDDLPDGGEERRLVEHWLRVLRRADPRSYLRARGWAG